ncbi:DNA repair and recombination protein RecA [Pseudoscourfieldia marina]
MLVRHVNMRGACSRSRPLRASSSSREDKIHCPKGLVNQRLRPPQAKASSKADSSADSSEASARAAALARVLDEIDGAFGRGTIMRLGDATRAIVETVPSGALTLDAALGGGYPKGRIIEVYGPESAGKTTLALHAMAEVQRRGGSAALIDAEHAFDPKYSARLGVDVDSLIICQPESGEMALQVVDQLVRSSAVDIVCVDSVAALVPRAEIEGEIGAVQIGAQARLMSQALRKITTNASRAGCTVVFINQLRHKIGVLFGSPEVTSGGNALKFYASVRLDIRRRETLKGSDGKERGIKARVKVVKNKVAPPYRIAEVDILFNKGICRAGAVLDAAEAAGIVLRKGAWYSYVLPDAPTEEPTRLAQGRDRAVEALDADSALLTSLESAVRAYLRSSDDAGANPWDEDSDDGSASFADETPARSSSASS